MRNKIYILLVLFFTVSFSNAQIARKNKPEKLVPQTVEAAFNLKFGKKDVVWFSRFEGLYDNKQVYEGRFMLDKRYSTAVYTPDGDLTAFVATVEYNEIPEKARNYMENKFPGRRIIDAALVTRGGNDVTYEISIYIDEEYIVKVFTNEGDFVKSTRG